MVLIVGCSRILRRPPDMPRNISLTVLDSRVEEKRQPAIDLPLTDFFSPRAIAAAAAIEAVPQLKDIRELEAQGGDQEVGLIKARMKLIGRILLAMEEVSSLKAEIECESDRADQVADRLQDEQSNRTKYETLGAIMVAGVAAIASGGVILAGLTTAEAAAAIAGGTISATLGTLPLFAESHQEFHHPGTSSATYGQGPPLPPFSRSLPGGISINNGMSGLKGTRIVWKLFRVGDRRAGWESLVRR